MSPSGSSVRTGGHCSPSLPPQHLSLHSGSIRPRYSLPEDNLTYRNMIVVHQQAIAYIEQHHPDATVLTACSLPPLNSSILSLVTPIAATKVFPYRKLLPHHIRTASCAGSRPVRHGAHLSLPSTPRPRSPLICSRTPPPARGRDFAENHDPLSARSCRRARRTASKKVFELNGRVGRGAAFRPAATTPASTQYRTIFFPPKANRSTLQSQRMRRLLSASSCSPPLASR